MRSQNPYVINFYYYHKPDLKKAHSRFFIATNLV